MPVELIMTSPRIPGGSLRLLAFIWFLGMMCPETLLWAQPGPEVVHSGLECIPNTQFAIVNATIRPSDEIKWARVYFRSDKYFDFYYVDMAATAEQFEAILPKPSPETSRVYYYIEAIDIAFSSGRTEEHDPEVVEDENECKRRDPAAAYFTGQSPGIVVGAIRSGLPAVPPGFLADGIAGFVSASGTGGGSGTTIALGVAAGAAGAAGVGLLAAGGDDASTTTTVPAVAAPPPPPETTTSIPVTGPSAVTACFTTVPDPPEIEVGERIKLDGRCSQPSGSLTYSWDLGDGRTRQGPFIEPGYATSGVYTVELIVRRASSLRGLAQTEEESDRITREVTVREPAPQGADLSIRKTSSPNPFVPFQQNVTYVITVENSGPADATGVRVIDNLPQEMLIYDDGGCTQTGPHQLTCDFGDLSAGESSEVVIIVEADDVSFGTFIENNAVVSGNEADPNPSNNAATERTNVAGIPLRTSTHRALLNQTFTSLLEVQGGRAGVAGQVTLNGQQSATVVSGTSSHLKFNGRPGRNVLEALIPSGDVKEGIWRFDLSSISHLKSGSFRVEAGQLLHMEGHAIVLRVTSGQRIRVSFELQR
jgi:uncharacterized repeat protein (TIGR01451 family)